MPVLRACMRAPHRAAASPCAHAAPPSLTSAAAQATGEQDPDRTNQFNILNIGFQHLMFTTSTFENQILNMFKKNIEYI